MGLQDAQRREPQGAQIPLQVTDIVLADTQVMEQIAGAVTVARLDQIEVLGVGLFESDGIVTQGLEQGNGPLQLPRGGFDHGRRAGNSRVR
jgi:hypothetical protein